MRVLHHLQSSWYYNVMKLQFKTHQTRTWHTQSDTCHHSDTFQNMTTPVAGSLHESLTNVLDESPLLLLSRIREHPLDEVKMLESNLPNVPVSLADHLQAKHMGQWNNTAKGHRVHVIVNPVRHAGAKDVTNVSHMFHPLVADPLLQERSLHIKQKNQYSQEILISFHKANQQKL